MLLAETIYNLSKQLEPSQAERLFAMLERDRQLQSTSAGKKIQAHKELVGQRCEQVLRHLQVRKAKQLIKKPGANH